jgi:excinuclease ABC subunit C
MPPELRRTVQRLPRSPGIYRFRDARGTVLYVGRATELRPRVASYWSKLRGRRHLTRMVGQIARIEAIACASVHEATWLERNLLERSLPRWNRTRGGQESPVYITLDDRLRITYTPEARSFGPYLGGQRARRAVRALLRLYPLTYTGTRLTGLSRDIAAKKGVTPADRTALRDAIEAVLDRRHDVHGDLVQLRNQAAEKEAFELAGQLQEEIEALDWITSPQRATVAYADDLTVHGWSDGVLVRFDIRAGRLNEWTQRRCTAARAEPLLATTPPAWTGFAQRTADLAATLLHNE